MEHLFNTTICPSREQIDRYLKGNCSEEELFQIENHLLDCELCGTAIEGFSQMGFKEEDVSFLDDFKTQLETKKRVSKEAITRTLEPNRRRLIFSRIAAAALMLMVFASGFMYWNDTQSDRLYEAYFEGIVANNTSRGVEESARKDSDLSNALHNYKKKQYEASLSQFDSYLERVPEDVEVLLYTGIANLESGHYQKADDLLTTVRINSERLFQDATWYLVLTKIKAAQSKEAVQLLEELIKKNESGFYADKARRLLRQIKK